MTNFLSIPTVVQLSQVYVKFKVWGGGGERMGYPDCRLTGWMNGDGEGGLWNALP